MSLNLIAVLVSNSVKVGVASVPARSAPPLRSLAAGQIDNPEHVGTGRGCGLSCGLLSHANRHGFAAGATLAEDLLLNISREICYVDGALHHFRRDSRGRDRGAAGSEQANFLPIAYPELLCVLDADFGKAIGVVEERGSVFALQGFAVPDKHVLIPEIQGVPEYEH